MERPAPVAGFPATLRLQLGAILGLPMPSALLTARQIPASHALPSKIQPAPPSISTRRPHSSILKPESPPKGADLQIPPAAH